MRPSGSTPHETGDNCGRPSRRVVASRPRWRGRRNSTSSSRSTVRAVAYFVAMAFSGRVRACCAHGLAHAFGLDHRRALARGACTSSVSDITSMGECEPDLQGVLVGGRRQDPAVGAWFGGRNELPERTWETRSEVVAADPGPSSRSWSTAPIARWGYTFTPVDGSATPRSPSRGSSCPAADGSSGSGSATTPTGDRRRRRRRCHGEACSAETLLDDDGRWMGHVDLGRVGVADRWADLAVATWSTVWNYGPGHEDRLLAVYGIARSRRTEFYRWLWNSGVTATDA